MGKVITMPQKARGGGEGGGPPSRSDEPRGRDGQVVDLLGDAVDEVDPEAAAEARRQQELQADLDDQRFLGREFLTWLVFHTDVAEGQTLTVEVFSAIPRVDVIGTSKGRGYSCVVKRHGFKGLRATHGVKRMHRHPGSSGPSADPARTRKGIRKPGQYGNARITVRNLSVVRVDPTNNLILVRGAVPGAPGGYVMIRKAIAAKPEPQPQVEKAGKVTVAKKAKK